MTASKQADTRSERRELVWLSVAGIVLVLAAILVPLLTGGASSTSLAQPSAWRENVSFVMVMVAFALIVLGLIQMVRAQMFTAARRERAQTLSIGQRRDMKRWIRRGEAAPHDMAAATAMTADVLVRQRKIMLSYVGIVLMMFGSALGTTSLWLLAFTIFAAVVMVVGIVLMRRDANLAHRWLEVHEHPASSEAPGA